MKVEQIKDTIGCAESSLRGWVQTYKQEGMTGLQLLYDHIAHYASMYCTPKVGDKKRIA
jgi:hypothetical protein